MNIDPSWVSIAITLTVLVLQVSSRYHKDTSNTWRTLEATFMSKMTEIQIQIVKLPENVLAKSNQIFVSNDRYVAEMAAIERRLQALEKK